MRYNEIVEAAPKVIHATSSTTLGDAIIMVISRIEAGDPTDPYGRDNYTQSNIRRKAQVITRFKHGMATAEAGVSQGMISPPEFRDAKADVNHALSMAWQDTFVDYPQVHTIAGKAKRADPATRDGAFLIALMPIGTLFAQLKDLVKKRESKPVEDMRAKYLAPRAGKTAVALVQAALMRITTDAYDGLHAQVLRRSEAIVDRFLAIQREAVEAGKRRPSAMEVYIRGDRPNHEAYEVVASVIENNLLVDNAEKILNDRATRIADDIRDSFVIKNLVKLDSIIEAKGNFEAVEVIGRSLGMDRLEGRLRIRFTDGSGFIVQNSVVWGHSPYGRPFTRFPLTFHDVMLPGGVKMARPSEERMNTVFQAPIEAA